MKKPWVKPWVGRLWFYCECEVCGLPVTDDGWHEWELEEVLCRP